MSAPQATIPATPAQPGYGNLPCPRCGEASACIDVCLMDAGFRCRDCEAEFTSDDVLDIIRRWQRVITWVATMPPSEEA